MSKYKVGDRVRFIGTKRYSFFVRDRIAIKGEEFIISSVGENKDLYSVEGAYKKEPDWCYMDTEFELVESNGNGNCNKIMTDIKTFVKNLALSSNEKLLRKHGFRDSCGVYTAEAKDFVLVKLCKEYRKDMVEIAKGLEEECNKCK